MFEQMLTPVKGWFRMSALDKKVPIRPSTATSPVTYTASDLPVTGRVGFIGADGCFTQGPGTGFEMPLFVTGGISRADVVNNGTSPGGFVNWISAIPSSAISCLVATGKYELQTTEFVNTSLTDPGLPLTAVSTDSADRGKLKIATVLTYATASDWICGVTSSHSNAACSEYRKYDATVTSATSYEADRLADTGKCIAPNAHGVDVLALWTMFLPAVAGD